MGVRSPCGQWWAMCRPMRLEVVVVAAKRIIASIRSCFRSFTFGLVDYLFDLKRHALPFRLGACGHMGFIEFSAAHSRSLSIEIPR